MWQARPGRQFSMPAWDLDLVLELLCSNQFNINVTSLDLTRKCIFLLGLALGCRISEFHSLLRGNRYIKFARNMKSVTLIPNACFIAKNETLDFRRQPMVVHALFKRDGSHSPLCPVLALKQYLELTQHCNSEKLFVSPVSAVPCNKGKISYYFLSLVRLSQPNVMASFHD